MTLIIPIRFSKLGRHKVPTVELAVKLARGGARMRESALVDTGSGLTLFPRNLLHLHRFPVRAAKKAPEPVQGIGGKTPVWYLEDAVIAVRDTTGALHPFNLERLFMTDSEFPPILGRGFCGR